MCYYSSEEPGEELEELELSKAGYEDTGDFSVSGLHLGLQWHSWLESCSGNW